MKNALILFFCSLIILIIFLPSFIKMQELRSRNVELQEETQRLLKKKQELEREKRRLVDDPEYLERVAREKMGMAKEGEVIFRMTPAVNAEEPLR